VRLERHAGQTLWVHRKGAQRVDAETLGIVPGSMGSPSFHVAGREAPEALYSAAHGAGRALSRSEARRRINVRKLDSQMRGVWFDARLRHALREEAPSAYKDIGEVMRAQRALVRIVRRLEPVLVYKAV
jgi:tRNA-splicing ligase RtcB